MIVIVDERQLVKEGYHSLFDREGVASAGFGSSDFGEWMTSAADEDLKSVRAFLIGDCGADTAKRIRDRTTAPMIALSEQHSLENTLRLFEAGVDDVVRKPVHIREMLARISAIRARHRDLAHRNRAMRILPGWTRPGDRQGSRCRCRAASAASSNIGVNFRPSRHQGTQVFNLIYGIFDDEVEENVVESHISKLRKKLRDKLGYDPIDSKRFLGYRLIVG